MVDWSMVSERKKSSMSTPDKPKYRLNPEPRISANQLAEYVLASPTRRQAILRNAKYAPTFLVIRYAAAREGIGRFLADDGRSPQPLITAQNELLQTAQDSSLSSFAQNDAALSAEAIKAFRAIPVAQKIPYATFTRNPDTLPKMNISGVEVSIRLDLIARDQGKGLIGGAIMQTSKAVASKSWRDEHSKLVASLVWMLSNKHLASLGSVDRKLCMSIDVFGGDIIVAPSSYKRKLNDVNASCVEIAALWPFITAPSDYEPI